VQKTGIENVGHALYSSSLYLFVNVGYFCFGQRVQK